MDLHFLEKKKDKWVIEVREESHTLLNLLREKTWEHGADQSSYIIEHPQTSQPKLIVRSKNPQKTLQDSAQAIIDDAKEFEKELRRAAREK